MVEWEVSYEDAHDPKYGEPFPVPIKLATKESVKGYGNLVPDFDKEEVEIVPWPVKGWRKLHKGTGVLGGVIRGDFACKWHGDTCSVVNNAVGWGSGMEHGLACGRLPKGADPKSRTHVLVREANYHPDGGQVFFPSGNEPFVLLLALPGDDIKLEDFIAFYFDGSCGFQIAPDVWHQSAIPIKDSTVFLNKQGAVHGCVAIDTVDEFGKYLLVPLTT